MKKLIIYVFSAVILSGMVACEKSLEVPNPNEIAEANFWKTENDALMGVNAIYSNAYRNGAYARWLSVYLNPRSDDGLASTSWAPLKSAVDFTTVDFNFEAARNIWAHHYRGIFRANQVLANVPGIQMNENLKGRLLAEAKFLRALYYFNLVNLWGNVPLVVTPSAYTDLPPQASQAQTWAQIERDLSEAVPVLPTTYTGNDVGRVTRGAAYAMLGKAYLQQGKHQLAADAFRWLVEGDGKGLYDHD